MAWYAVAACQALLFRGFLCLLIWERSTLCPSHPYIVNLVKSVSPFHPVVIRLLYGDALCELSQDFSSIGYVG
ncbi:hypothetical protein GGS23DRAFT_542989 [Durotheca rogersii]|uniref:uncharacterized protein n=1 Tax=Durotheca rogersii TaxID=419775 RepID=UPI002220C60B|nr:uncharacterized protein GGS23DRAFT_542989 [Durotheca rogersii]KAI5867888.1 hypothetical protein GGS23DRAFT_542989 [Durotheca rogersii]